MIEEYLEAIKAAKIAHAQEVLAALAEVETVMNSKPELWFGGLPPSFNNLKDNINFMTRQIEESFDLD